MVLLERIQPKLAQMPDGKKKLRKKKLLYPEKVLGKKVGRTDVLEEEEKRRKKKRLKKTLSTKGGKFKTNPSKYPTLQEWKHKKNPNRWNTLDWAGFWICSWQILYGQEDPDYINVGLSERIKFKDRFQNDIWCLGLNIEKLRDNGRGFRGDGHGTLEYLKWLFIEFLPDAQWMDEPISGRQALRVRKNFFIRKFKTRDVKAKGGKGAKGTGKWNPWGISYDN